MSLPHLCPAMSSSQSWDVLPRGVRFWGAEPHSQRGPKGQCQAPYEPSKERPVTVFLDESNISISGPSKADTFPHVGGFYGSVETKRLTLLLIRGNSCLTVLSWDRRFSCLWDQTEISILLDLEPGSLWRATPLAFLGLSPAC